MAGLCGLIGDNSRSVEEISPGLYYHNDEDSSIFEDNQLSIGYVDHPISFEEQPVNSKTGDSLVWVWGYVLGYEHDGKYIKQPNELTDAEYCASLYDSYGRSFPSGLNSEFSGIIYNKEQKKVSLFTDRLGSRPIYYTHTDSGALVFSSLLQPLQLHPEVSFEYNKDYLSEFFSYSRSLGVHTPVEGVKILPPASITDFDLDGTRLNQQTYWSPKFQQLDLSFSEIVNRFQEIFTEAVRDRIDENRKNGLLLSGGSDSRAILAAFDGELTAFHMNELSENIEAQLAKEIAETAGVQFQFLQRGTDYHLQTLDNCSDIMNFNGSYHSAKGIGFSERITDEVDVVFWGQYSDTVIGDTYVPTRSNQNSIDIESVHQYVKEFNKGSMGGYLGELPFVDSLPVPADVFKSNLNETEDVIVSHGIQYPSWKSLIEFGIIYPLTNVRTFVNYETQVQMAPTHYPYLDNRLIDLILQTPSEYRYGKDIVAETVSQIDSELASIPHASTGMPLSKPTFLQRMKGRAKNNKYINHLLTTPKEEIPTDFLDFVGLVDKTSTTHVSSGSWINKAGVIRAHPFVENKLREHEEILVDAGFLNKEATWETYKQHREGENHSYELFCLLTFLEIASNIKSNSSF